MNHAIKALKQQIAEVANLQLKMGELNQRISLAQQAISDAQAPQQQVGELKAKRRSILGSLFLGNGGDEAELKETEAAILSAEKSAKAKERDREGAEAAIDELLSQLNDAGTKLNEKNRETTNLLHAAMIAHASEALPAYLAAAEKLAQAYGELVGRGRSADVLASPENGRPFMTFGCPPNIDIPRLPLIPGANTAPNFLNVQDGIDRAAAETHRFFENIANSATN